MPKFNDPKLIVGFDTSDDASVYLLDENTAIIQTVDLFPPIVDDPYEYGLIAASNALSDIYAMGGSPKLAMNIFCIPENLPKDVIQGIMQGGYEKVAEADALITGGHTLKDSEPKYGLSVTGFAHPSEVLTNNRAKPGDIVILTKALGTGVLSTAAKSGLIDRKAYEELVASMITLNKYAAEVVKCFPVNSCTDVTGFGLAGHAFEMAHGSKCTITIKSGDLPLLNGAREMAQMGIIPKGAYNNRDYLKSYTAIRDSVPLFLSDLVFDPQTSGGLLITIPEKEGTKLLSALNDVVPVAKIAGFVDEYQKNYIQVE